MVSLPYTLPSGAGRLLVHFTQCDLYALTERLRLMQKKIGRMHFLFVHESKGQTTF